MSIENASQPESWLVQFTGDMTLSIVSSSNEQVLKVDMLKHGTMTAGDDGLFLVQTVNDMTMIASLPRVLQGDPFPPLKHPDAGLSEGPWTVSVDDQARRLHLRLKGKLVAQRTFPARLTQLYTSSRDVLTQGLPLLNSWLERGQLSRD